MGAVWLVRSRQMAARFRFWLAMFGYNPRDHSISHKIYLLYAAIFYALWGFMVLTLLADGTGKMLTATRIEPPADAALAIAAAGLLGWTLLSALGASRRSPILFTEDELVPDLPDACRPVCGRPGLVAGPVGFAGADHCGGSGNAWLRGGRGQFTCRPYDRRFASLFAGRCANCLAGAATAPGSERPGLGPGRLSPGRGAPGAALVLAAGGCDRSGTGWVDLDRRVGRTGRFCSGWLAGCAGPVSLDCDSPASGPTPSGRISGNWPGHQACLWRWRLS